MAPPVGGYTRPLEIELPRTLVLIVLAALAILVVLPALLHFASAGST
jgi:hypothetical protein